MDYQSCHWEAQIELRQALALEYSKLCFGGEM